MRRWQICMAVAWLMAALAGAPARAENLLERAVARLEPCRSLKVDTGFAKVGIDKTDKVVVDSARIDIRGDTAEAEANASLTCRTGGGIVNGDATATFRVGFSLDLTTCTLGRSEVAILSTGGTFGDVVDALKDVIAATITQRMAAQLKTLCR